MRIRLLELSADERVVLCKSEGRKDKETAIRSGAERRLLEELHKLDKRLKSGRLQEGDKVQRAIGKILSQHSRVQRYYTARLQDKACPQAGLFWQRKDEGYQADGDLLGCYVLRTDRAGLTAEEIWRLYVTLSKAEEAFCVLKGDLGLRPNFHSLEKRVDAHIFISVLAYHLLKHISYTLSKTGDHRDWATIRRILQTHCYTTIHVPTRDGVMYHLRKPGEAEAAQLQIYQAFGINLAKLPKTKIIARKETPSIL